MKHLEKYFMSRSGPILLSFLEIVHTQKKLIDLQGVAKKSCFSIKSRFMTLTTMASHRLSNIVGAVSLLSGYLQVQMLRPVFHLSHDKLI